MSVKSTCSTVVINKGLWDYLDEWIKTEHAKKLGFHSKAQFATEAIRKLLLEYDKND